MEDELKKVYYAPRGHWKGKAAVDKLYSATKLDKKLIQQWLERQPIWQIYQPAPKNIVRPRIIVSKPNDTHQCDLLYLPHDKVGRRTYKFAVCVVDVASRFKAAAPITNKTANEVLKGLDYIYRGGDLVWPRVLQVDSGTEFMGAVAKACEDHNTTIKRVEKGNHRKQGIVERFNRTLGERLFGGQYAEELRLGGDVASLLPHGSDGRSRKWVKELPEIVEELNNTPTRQTKMKPAEAIKRKEVSVKRNMAGVTAEQGDRGAPEFNDMIRYLYFAGEKEGGTRRATDPIWSLTVHNVSGVLHGERELYYLTPSLGPFNKDKPAPPRSFVREELYVIPRDTDFEN